MEINMRTTKVLILLAILSSLACAGRNVTNGKDGKNGSSCSVQTLTNGALISCEDGTSSLILNGEKGKSCTTTKTSNGALIACEDGTSAVVLNGNDGNNGLNGSDGVNGVDGTNGTNGTDGRDGVDTSMTAYTVVEVIDPCGRQTMFDEIMLRLANGQLMAVYADPSNQFLTFVPPGTYMTTDGTKCIFTVTPELQIKW
jgi:hypothetical protein